MAGSLGDKLAAIRGAGFSQVMLSAADIAGHPGGLTAAAAEVRASGLRVTGFQVLRDFEGLSGHLHEYKLDIAKAMLEMCKALDCRVLLACSSTSSHAIGDAALLARDLRKLAMLALPFGIRIAYEALSWGRYVSEVAMAWDVVQRAACPNLGLGIDSFHLLAVAGEAPAGSSHEALDALEDIDPERVFLVQLSDFMWNEIHSREERIATARHFRVFPGEGVHSAALAELVVRLDRLGYEGDYSFEVFNDDYRQLLPATVAERARRSAQWLAEDVLRRSTPEPNRIRLRPG
jgi:sugar phosphate isomerase/epimerase